MKKVPTVFQRDWNGDRSRVIPFVVPGCEWVSLGEGVATRKLDGTCCMVRGGKLYKRRELRGQDGTPPNFEGVDHDAETGKTIGWVPVGDGPDDCWHREAFAYRAIPEDKEPLPDGTYELIGPKIQGNPEGVAEHQLVPHGAVQYAEGVVPRTFEGLRDWLAEHDIEGIVFHHPDGRMAKIKLRDFGHRRAKTAA